MQLKRGLERAVDTVTKELAQQSKPVQSRAEIAQIGTISANGDRTVGEMVAAAMDKVGKDGVITLEEAKGTETTLEVVDGMRFDRGYISPYFVTDPEKMRCLLEEPYILLSGKKISVMADLLPVLEGILQSQKPLLIVAEDVDGEALATLVINKLRGALLAAAVKAPGFGDRRKEMLEDIAILTDGQVVSDELGVKLDQLKLTDLGRAKRVEITKDETILIDGGGEQKAIAGRVEVIKRQLQEAKNDYDKEKLRDRLAKLTGGVAVIEVGAPSELEMKERKDLVDDAIHAAQAAAEEGIVAGGGVALLRCQVAIDALELEPEQRPGALILRRALEEPLRLIAANAGIDGAVVAQRVREGSGGFGYNAATESYEDLFATGVIDPTKVVRVALQNAVSVAGLLLTTDAVVAELPANTGSELSSMAGLDEDY